MLGMEEEEVEEKENKEGEALEHFRIQCRKSTSPLQPSECRCRPFPPAPPPTLPTAAAGAVAAAKKSATLMPSETQPLYRHLPQRIVARDPSPPIDLTEVKEAVS